MTRKAKAPAAQAEAQSTRNDDNWAEAIGKPSYEAIAEMVAALQCDYERLEELRDERDEWNPDENNDDSWTDANPDDAQALRDLEAEAGDCQDKENARTRIEEDPLSLEVRSGWMSLGEELKPEEFCLLLGTGGPAVRIVGDLDEYGEPERPRLEVQDWFKPWTEYVPADEGTLLAYCRVFYFGR